jgi:acyl-CoA thioesterase
MGNAPYARFLGFRLVEVRPGYARVTAKLSTDYSNFRGGTDGGFIMSLADYAFACSCNSFGPPRVAIQFGVNFIAAPQAAAELVAEARTIHHGKSLSLTEITVTDFTGKLIARASGTALASPGAGSGQIPTPLP